VLAHRIVLKANAQLELAVPVDLLVLVEIAVLVVTAQALAARVIKVLVKQERLEPAPVVLFATVETIVNVHHARLESKAPAVALRLLGNARLVIHVLVETIVNVATHVSVQVVQESRRLSLNHAKRNA